jgi:hypothetical protein
MYDSAFLWEHAIFGPRPTVTPRPIHMKFRTINYVGEVTRCAKNGSDRFSGGLLSIYVKYTVTGGVYPFFILPDLPSPNGNSHLYQNGLQKPNNAITALLSSFFYRSSDAWNYLPSNLRHAPSTSTFKKAVKCIDLSTFLKGASVRP